MPIRDSSIPVLARHGLPLTNMTHNADTIRHNLPPVNPIPKSRTLNLRSAPALDFGLWTSDPCTRRLAISNPADLRFGVAPKPLTTCRGLTIGGGIVYPELNFTLPPMLVNESTMPEVRAQYQQIITSALHRAVELETPGLVVEFETLPPMTENPAWGIELTRILLDAMAEAHAKHSLKSVLRITPNDTREMVRPPRMRSGPLYEAMLATFDGCAAAGAELLSIESVGGKEVHDEALMMGDLRGVIFGLCVLGVRDMRFLWTQLAQIARKHGVHCAGDTACGFGNTAMVLAEQKMIPRVFAAVVRAVSAVRTLVCYQCGAVGPGKDCGYENPILKAITGFPMAMEGKTAACAHFSPLGNIAAATCDTWSNESVQNIKLLAGMAPTCYVEQLIYDCRLMNEALADGRDAALLYRKWMVASDASRDPQAYVLMPESSVAIAQAIISAPSAYDAGKAAALTALRLIREAHRDGALNLIPREVPWLDRLQQTVEALPAKESEFIDEMMGEVDTTKFVARDYEIG
jgi:methanol--5-hydroxybenzimidazolylcobamide Co-methyltransferase